MLNAPILSRFVKFRHVIFVSRTGHHTKKALYLKGFLLFFCYNAGKMRDFSLFMLAIFVFLQ